MWCLLAGVVCSTAFAPYGFADFLRGDVNQDGKVSIADVLFIHRYLFLGDRVPACKDSADANDDGRIRIDDQIVMLNAVFSGTAVIPEPYPLPGEDATADELDCATYEVVAAGATDDVIRVGSATAAPGAEVLIPIYVTTKSVPVEAFQLAIEADPFIFELEDGSGMDFSGTVIEEVCERGYPDYAIATSDEDTECILVASMFSFMEVSQIPASEEEQLLLYLVGSVPEETPDGTVIQLYPTNGPDGEGVGEHGVMNELAYRGEAAYAAVLPQRLEGGALHVKNLDSVDFIRADAAGNEQFPGYVALGLPHLVDRLFDPLRTGITGRVLPVDRPQQFAVWR